jgi:hypothetical protein
MSAWLRETAAAGGGIAPQEFPEWQSALVALESFLASTRREETVGSWQLWAVAFDRTEADLHWGTLGRVDQAFYDEVYAFLDRNDAPAVARAAVDLKHAFSLLEWERAAAAADELVSRVGVGEQWSSADILLDMSVIAYLKAGRATAARNAIDLLTPWTGRQPGDLRLRMLDALVARAEASSAQP